MQINARFSSSLGLTQESLLSSALGRELRFQKRSGPDFNCQKNQVCTQRTNDFSLGCIDLDLHASGYVRTYLIIDNVLPMCFHKANLNTILLIIAGLLIL